MVAYLTVVVSRLPTGSLSRGIFLGTLRSAAFHVRMAVSIGWNAVLFSDIFGQVSVPATGNPCSSGR